MSLLPRDEAARTIREHRTSHISLLASLVKKTVVNPFWQLTRLLEIIEPSINYVPVLDGSYKLPNGRRALPFEMVEVRKKRGVTIHS